jgi:hypothetical protein
MAAPRSGPATVGSTARRGGLPGTIRAPTRSRGVGCHARQTALAKGQGPARAGRAPALIPSRASRVWRPPDFRLGRNPVELSPGLRLTYVSPPRIDTRRRPTGLRGAGSSAARRANAPRTARREPGVSRTLWQLPKSPYSAHGTPGSTLLDAPTPAGETRSRGARRERAGGWPRTPRPQPEIKVDWCLFFGASGVESLWGDERNLGNTGRKGRKGSWRRSCAVAI